jgi:hypothetical protein
MQTDPQPEWTLHIVSNTHWDREMNSLKKVDHENTTF